MSLLTDLKEKINQGSSNAWFKVMLDGEIKATIEANVTGDDELDYINQYRKKFEVKQISKEEFERLTNIFHPENNSEIDEILKNSLKNL